MSAPPSAPPSRSSTPASASAAEADTAAAQQAAADKKRAFRAAKKAEQERRKEERKRFAQETGVDPALLPDAIAGDLARNGRVEAKGFKAREWVDVPAQNGQDAVVDGKRVSIVSWNVSRPAFS